MKTLLRSFVCFVCFVGHAQSSSATLSGIVEDFINHDIITHLNTLLHRLARADELLPRPLAESTVPVAVALEVLRWRG